MPDPSGRGTGWVLAQIPLLLAATITPVGERIACEHESGSSANRRITRSLGLAGVGLGVLLFWKAKGVLGRGLVPYPQPPVGAVLRKTGIYGRVRHPIYLSLLCFTTGWALLWRSRLGLMLVLPTIAFFQAKSRHEEQLLLVRFPEYSGYRRRVPGFIPRWRSASSA